MLTAMLVAAILSGNDGLAAAWKGRAERATQRLATAKLDACDRALEVAFQTPTRTVTEAGEVQYALGIRIGAESMVAYYAYKGREFSDFGVYQLPSTWMLHQPAKSKTVSVLVGKASCAFDLCANDPFSDGPCAEPAK